MRWSLAVALAVVLLVDPGTAARAADIGLPPATRAASGERLSDGGTRALSGEDAAAMHRAQRDGRPVEIIDRRTATGSDYANPGGSFTHREYARPVRVRQAGAWIPVDLRLVDRGGRVVPAAAAQAVTFSGGGRVPFATLRTAAWSVALRWPAPLPRPVLAGPTARYADVLPGVDLTVTATDAGFAQNLVVRDRRSVVSGALRRIRLGLDVRGVRAVPADGGLQLRDSSETPVATVPAPAMWDAAVGANGGARTARVGMAIDRTGLVLHPDQAMLTDERTRYPVTVDPSFAAGRLDWTIVQSGWPGVSYWNGNAVAADSNGRVMVGHDPYYGDVARGFFRMGTAAVNGKHILKATFQTTEKWAYSCTASPVELWQTGPIGSGTTWNNQPAWSSRVATANVAKGNEGIGCGDGSVEFDATGAVRTAASSGWPDLTLGLRASDEGSATGWKRFDDNPSLAIDYNTVPNTPDQLSIDGKSCGAGTWLGTTTPVMRARVSDPDDGQTQTATLYWAPAGAGISDSNRVVQTNVANGATTVAAVPSGRLNDGEYYFQAMTSDGTDTSALSGRCAFTVDHTAPSAPPTVTSSDYPADGNFHGGVGRPGQFVLHAAGVSDVRAYRWGWADPPTTAVDAATLGGDATLTATPGEAGLNTLYVRSEDRAGNWSAVTRYVFLAGSATPPVAQWDADEGSGSTVADASGGNHPLTLGGSAGWTAGRSRLADHALALDGTAGYGTATAVLADSSGSFTASAWVRLDATGRFASAVSQNGATASSFNLGYSGSAWVFAVHDVDAGSKVVKPVQLTADLPVTTGVWTHLTGVYDAGAHQARLYVNGEPAGRADNVPTFASHGSLDVGRARWEAGWRDFWPGAIDSVRVYDRMLGDDEIRTMANPVTEQGSWDLTGTGDDGSAYQRPLHASGAVSWGAGHDGTGGATLAAGGKLTTDGPVLLTDQSYTLAAWVRLTDKATYRGVLAQPGSRCSPFYLQYDKGQDRWAFAVYATDSDTSAYAKQWSADPARTDVWTHLAAVYDAGRRQIRLYVNGRLEATTAATATFGATGGFTVGQARTNGSASDQWLGDIDHVRTYQGVLSDAQIADLANR